VSILIWLEPTTVSAGGTIEVGIRPVGTSTPTTCEFTAAAGETTASGICIIDRPGDGSAAARYSFVAAESDLAAGAQLNAWAVPVAPIRLGS